MDESRSNEMPTPTPDWTVAAAVKWMSGIGMEFFWKAAELELPSGKIAFAVALAIGQGPADELVAMMEADDDGPAEPLDCEVCGIPSGRETLCAEHMKEWEASPEAESLRATTGPVDTRPVMDFVKRRRAELGLPATAGQAAEEPGAAAQERDEALAELAILRRFAKRIDEGEVGDAVAVVEAVKERDTALEQLVASAGTQPVQDLAGALKQATEDRDEARAQLAAVLVALDQAGAPTRRTEIFGRTRGGQMLEESSPLSLAERVQELASQRDQALHELEHRHEVRLRWEQQLANERDAARAHVSRMKETLRDVLKQTGLALGLLGTTPIEALERDLTEALRSAGRAAEVALKATPDAPDTEPRERELLATLQETLAWVALATVTNDHPVARSNAEKTLARVQAALRGTR